MLKREVSEKRSVEFVAEFPIDTIVVEKEPLRSLMQERPFEELRASIRDHGVLIPIHLTRAGEDYRLVAGLRRLRACLSLGMAVIPALVSEMETSEELWAKFAENRVRASVSGLDEGLYIAERMNATRETQAEIALILGVSESWVSQRVGVLRWPREVQDSLGRRTISFGVGREIAAIDDVRLRKHYLRFAELDGCSVRQAADWRRRAAKASGSLPGSVPDEASPGPESVVEGFEESCFMCECRISFGGGKYIRLCERCEERVVEAIDRSVLAEPKGDPPGG